MDVRQGDIYHVKLPPPVGSGPGDPHFAVVVQHDSKNDSTLRTTVVCLLTTVISKAKVRGNVVLMPDEGNLPEHSAVNVSQILTLDNKEYLGERIGRVYPETMLRILEAIRVTFEGREPRY